MLPMKSVVLQPVTGVRSDRRIRRLVTRRFLRHGGATLTIVGLLVAGCARGSGGNGDFRAVDQQQSEQCDGVPPPPTLALLEETAAVVSTVMCVTGDQYFPGEGSWAVSTVREVPPDRIPELVAGLRLPDLAQSRNGCDLSMGVLPDFVVTLDNGSRTRPAVAGDGCHARRDALAAFHDVASMPVVGTTRTTQVRTEIDVVAGCGTGGKSPAMWLESSAAVAARVTLPTAGKVSVCRYHPTAGQEGELAAAGIVPAADFTRSWPVSSNGPADCAQPTDPMQTTAVDWVLLLQTPDPPYRLDQPAARPIALIELGGCHRVVDPRAGLVGFVDASAAAGIAARADRPAR